MWAPPPSPPPSASPQTWIDFFQVQDANYTYKNSGDPAYSYYPHNAWNQYYFADVDCSAYVAWVTYNVMNTQRGNDGYVMSSTKMAQTFAQTYNFGTWTQEFSSAQDFNPGDIFSMNGHVWICLGVCGDGSKNIVAGYGNGTFGPNDPLTREQTTAILYRFAQVQGLNPKDDGTLSGFSDQSQVQERALSAMEWAVSSGLISGTDLGTLIPQAGATRAQMAVILINFCQQMDK